ncbi:MAG: response regulator transcription factor, partial [Pseudanabaena sp.]
MTLDHLKILLVEDDELFRLGLQVRLQQETKIAVLAEANDGETAIDLAKQKPFDLVLLDIGLPGLGGLETCR